MQYESSASDHSKYITFRPWADLFTRTPSGLLWEEFSHAASTSPILSFHYIGEGTEALWKERKLPCFETMFGKGD